jgi:Asp-tRNA(Asn)/Glu-tRNA(Gln) amidotransferase A subunit family amidase
LRAGALVLTAVTVVGASSLVAAPASADPAVPTIAIDTAAAATEGTTLDVSVSASGTADLYAYSLRISYDPKLLEFDPDSLQGPKDGFTVDTTGDGSLTITSTRLGTSPGLSGDTGLGSFSFTVIDGGTAHISVANASLVDSSDRATPLTDAAAASVALTGLPGHRHAHSAADAIAEHRPDGRPRIPSTDPANAPFLAPYYTELDQTGDKQVTTDDLAVLADDLGKTKADADWASVSKLDFDGDGAIDASDLAELSHRMIYDDGPFQIVEASAVDMQAAMNAGVTTSVKITQQYIDRIAAYDRVKIDPAAGGRPLNSIITVGAKTALAAAAAADATRAAHGMTSVLLGVPIVLKDNYDTADMPTTAGCGCWDANQTATDATMVKGLRAEGAVILAKAAMDEFAINLTSQFSAFQAPGTALDVASPLSTSRTSGGSSGGTGASISANLAGIGFGTDTGGSIRVPSSYNSLVGVRPTVGLTSRAGIVPLALSQDTGGPIARSVTDAAVALDAVVGADPADPITQNQIGKVPAAYESYLDADSLKGAKIGYVTSMLGTNPGTLALWQKTKSLLESKGATVVEITPPTGFSAILAEGSGSGPEFNHDLQNYIDTYLNPAVTARSLLAISQSDNIDPGRASNPYGQRAAVTPDAYQAWAGPTGTHTVQLAAGKQLVTQLMDGMGLDAIVYPTGNPYSTIGSNLRLSPNTGLPAVTVPMGWVPVGAGVTTAGNVNLEWLGRDYSEGPLLGLAYAFEQATHARTSPALYGPLK